MQMRTVRILVEDEKTKELTWYASFKIQETLLNITIDGHNLKLDACMPDDVLTTFSTTVSYLDLAVELYNTYCESSGGLNYQGKPCPKWNDLPAAIRMHWTAVAKRITSLGALYNSPRNEFDVSDTPHVPEFAFGHIDMESGEG